MGLLNPVVCSRVKKITVLKLISKAKLQPDNDRENVRLKILRSLSIVIADRLVRRRLRQNKTASVR